MFLTFDSAIVKHVGGCEWVQKKGDSDIQVVQETTHTEAIEHKADSESNLHMKLNPLTSIKFSSDSMFTCTHVLLLHFN